MWKRIHFGTKRVESITTFFHEHLPQSAVGVLALEDGAAGGCELLGHAVHEEHFPALGLNGET